LTGAVSGNVSGTINYIFYCDRSDSGTNITSGWLERVDNTSAELLTTSNSCSYSSAGIYIAKVIVERGTLVAENRTSVNVNPSLCSDGTPYNQCSTNKPKYCENGILIDNCSLCGCSSGQICQPDKTCQRQPSVKSAILVDTRLYNLISDDLNQYIALAKDKRKFEIVIQSHNGIDDWRPSQVKEAIVNLKNDYPELEGVLLVGNIKLPSFYKSRADNLLTRLFTQYYGDLDGTFSRLYAPGSLDPLCPTNTPHCNWVGNVTVPEHDFDYMEKGTNPKPELWISVLPVGFSDPSRNNYNDYAEQLRPFFEKAIRFYRGELVAAKKIYKVSNQLWDLTDIWNYYGPQNIDFYAVNPDPIGTAPPGTPAENFCMRNRIASQCYLRAPLENYSSFSNFWSFFQTRDWMGEGWQVPEIYLPHLTANNYEFVWVNVHSGSESSLISNSEAKSLSHGGLVMLGSGCAVAEFYQPGSSSYVNSSTPPDNNILVSYVYGNSNFIAALGDPFYRGHEAYFEKLIPFVNQGDYLGLAFLKRWQIQYENSSDVWNLKENSQEMLIGDPFISF